MDARGRRGGRARLFAGAVALALFVVLVPDAAQARTQVNRFTIEVEDVDPFLTDQCGTTVNVTVEIDVTHHAFDDDPLRHRQEEKGTVEFASDHGTVVQVWRHAGPHEVVELLEEIEPDVFLVRVRAVANGTLWLETGDGEVLERDAGTVEFDDVGIWDRNTGELIGPLESTVERVAGPHPLLDDATFISTVCGELAP